MMETRALGMSGQTLSAIGLGCMGMSDVYGPADRQESIRTIHEALDAGITLLDTGDFYGSGHNELLVAEALHGRKRDEVFVAVKFGAMRTPQRGFGSIDCRPAAVKNFLAYTLQRLGLEYVDLYQPSRVDPNVPIEDTIGAIKEMIEAGYVRHIGLSEAGPDTLRRAHRVHPIAWLQTEYSLMSRGIEAEILRAARELGVTISAYGVLSRGLLSGRWSEERSVASNDPRARNFPRFSGDNLRKNLALVESLRRIAEQIGTSVAQAAIGWILSRGDDIIPLIGARTRGQLHEALAAVDRHLSADDLARIEEAIPPDATAGERYNAQGMTTLDSERDRRSPRSPAE
jgi:pyridoxine 4-dehydrogenase